MTSAVLNYKTPDFRVFVNSPQMKGVEEFVQVIAKFQDDIPTELLQKDTPDRVPKIMAILAEKPEARIMLREIGLRRRRIVERYNDPRVKEIKNARTLSSASLLSNGFVLRKHSSVVRNWNDSVEVANEYYSEIAELVKNEIGATHAFCCTHTIRNSEQLDQLEASAFALATLPLRAVHNDFTNDYKRMFMECYDGQVTDFVNFGALQVMKDLGISKQMLKNSRVIMVNTWRNIQDEPLKRLPLAVCDQRTVSQEELIKSSVARAKNNFGLDVYTSEYKEEHSFYYYPEMLKDEVLLFKTYDSEMNPFTPTLHTAFEDPNHPNGTRKSCEARVFCLLPREAAKL